MRFSAFYPIYYFFDKLKLAWEPRNEPIWFKYESFDSQPVCMVIADQIYFWTDRVI